MMVARLTGKALENTGRRWVVSVAGIHQTVVAAPAVGGWRGVAVGVLRGVVWPELGIKVHSACVPLR